jgi:pimeloyl-ACP methyl ester carboxylesterase
MRLLILASCVALNVARGQATPLQTVNRTVASADGTTIAYSVTGMGSTALVFVHGWACDRSYWREQVPFFAPAFKVITLDLAGHGLSGRTRTDWSIARFAEDVEAVVRDAGVERAVLIGHSLGGPIVVEAALRMPRQSTAVVGVDTFLDQWRPASFTSFVARLRADFVPTVNGFVRTVLFNAQSDTTLRAQVAASMSAVSPEIGASAMAALIPWLGQRSAQAFGELRVPLATIQSSGSARRMVGAGRGADVVFDEVLFTGLSHFLMIENPSRFNAVLDSLVRKTLK